MLRSVPIDIITIRSVLWERNSSCNWWSCWWLQQL